MTNDMDLNALQRPGPFPGEPNGDYPTLHDWMPLRSGTEIRLSGSVRNHPELADGEIVTSPLREIACDRSWCRTFNTLYLLGQQAAEKAVPDQPLPLLLRVLLAECWPQASRIACDAMMPHRLLLDPQADTDFVEIRLNADTMALSEGQQRAAAIHARIADGAMPHSVVDAWQALAAETSTPGACRPTAMAGAAAYDRWYAKASEDETARLLRRRLAGWRELADEDRRPLNGSGPDQFKLAQALGEEDPDEDGVPEGGLLDKLRGLRPVEDIRPETLAWFAASMPTRRMAADLVVRVNRKTLVTGEGAEALVAFGRENGFDEPVSTNSASSMSRRLQEIARRMGSNPAAPVLAGLARAWSVLAADMTWRQTSIRDAARAATRAAEIHARSLMPGEPTDTFRNRSAALLAAWALLSTGPEDVPGEPKDDAIMAAHFHRKRLCKSIGSIDDDGEEAEPEPMADGVIVLAAVGGTKHTSGGKEAAKEFESIVGRPVPLAPVPDLAVARSKLAAEFPYALTAIDLLLADLAGGVQHIHFRPSLLLGPPGGGKTRFIRKLASALSVPVSRFDGSGSSDNAFGGTPRRWSSGEPCFPLTAIQAAGIANPICHVDEIDKAAGNSRHNGSLMLALLPMVEPENSKRFSDPYLHSDVDLSFVSFLLTANDDTGLPAPLRDRLRVIRIPQPTVQDLPAISHGLIEDIMTEKGAKDFAVPLDGDEFHIAAALWKGGSIRKLRAIIERLLSRRDEQQARH